MKKLVLILIVATITVPLLFSATTTDFRQFQLRIRRYVPEDTLVYYFANIDGTNIPSKEKDLSTDLGLEYSEDNIQVKLVGRTNYVTIPYVIYLTFTPMMRYDLSSTDKYLYEAAIYSSGGTLLRNITFNSNKENKTVELTGQNATNAEKTIDIVYPITFKFSDYLSSYETNIKYSATITMEVETV